MLNFSDYPEVVEVFRFFEEISKIPHGSGHTDEIADYLVDFAKKRGLIYIRDEANNVIIKKAATKGFEARPTVILQGHTDMVAEKSADSPINMLTDGLELYRDGDFLRARGTTLGGDDGVAVAYALALLDSDDIAHPAIEAVFTSDEEIGLIGAGALNGEHIDGRIMINIDSDAEGIFTVGCAGGARIDITLPMKLSDTGATGYAITVDGLKGGHSGVEINKGRHNAVKILADILIGCKGARIFSLVGGNADNVIPRRAESFICCNKDELDRSIDSALKKYRSIEPDLNVTVSEATSEKIYDLESSKALISLINSEPSGVISMSEDIKGLVETSLNLGIAKSNDTSASISFSVRSSKGTEKENLLTRVRKIAEEHGATHKTHGEYPGWEYKKDSRLRDVMCQVYEREYGVAAEVITIHAGLECGIFSDKLVGLDCVSIGPNNFDIHTVEERLSISSTARVWDFLKKVLKEI
jgi:dipeptidase D